MDPARLNFAWRRQTILSNKLNLGIGKSFVVRTRNNFQCTVAFIDIVKMNSDVLSLPEHEGREVTEGVKYVLRTDVMFKLKQ